MRLLREIDSGLMASGPAAARLTPFRVPRPSPVAGSRSAATLGAVLPRLLPLAAAALLLALAAALLLRPSAERAEAPEGAAVPQLAWFYKPPTDGTTPAELLARFGFVVLTKNDEGYLAELREAGWEAKVPQYVGLPWVRGPAGHERPGPCASPGSIAGNSFAWFAGDFCERLHPHEGVFLHNGRGERLHRDPGDGGGWLYAVDPADPTWRAFVAERIDQAFAGDGDGGPWGYEGLFLDEAWATRHHLLETYANADGTLREYASDGEWRRALRGLVAAVRERVDGHGHRTWLNTDHDASAYDDLADGIMVENFAASWGGARLPPGEQLALWERIDERAAEGRRLLLVGQGDRDDAERLRYAYAAYLMVAAPEVRFRYSRDPDGYRELWPFPEYDAPLGEPAAPRAPEGGGVWRRDFAGGAALVNLAAGGPARPVDLGGRFRTLAGAEVTELSLAPGRGVVLLAAGR
jgi:hypothetical protein